MKVLVTGAAGNVGLNVVHQLVTENWDVRVLTRRAQASAFPEGVNVCIGDLSRPETLTDALSNVEALFLFPVPETAEAVVSKAEKAGVRRIVVLSSAAVTTGIDTDFHLAVEQAVEASGLEYTHVRPGEFATNKLALWGPPIRAERVVRDPAPSVASFPVHEQDIADVAFLALTTDGHAGQAYTLDGPELLTRRQQAELIGEAIREDIRFEVVTPHEARKIYLAQGGIAAEYADFILGFRDYDGNEANPSDIEKLDYSSLGPRPTAEAVTGRPARTFLQWAKDHAQDFYR
ncbi:SDR family oxidoreductase [Saccharopolyspora phatthalungensis]|uniref:Uncharacterized protein YbjT (DUF2867 family) n=1 Tax=Saccharopolyspora phatthalungensis TaxID=664693 RepID=A0A840Q8U4_9PSEU|nr:NAD(P)H-binding protein [Saccharopolyspora phatthalungensis]MBB5156866.1 uncharacterized protein YbjT (DUF2867 family) [Saccharopolyspora phatthalungensis]